MKNSLSERIAERVGKKPSIIAKNKSAFLALLPEIKKALDDGWSMKDIWETLHAEGKLTFSYQAFLGYVKRLIVKIPKEIKKEDLKLNKNKGQLEGFKYEPNPDKKELL